MLLDFNICREKLQTNGSKVIGFAWCSDAIASCSVCLESSSKRQMRFECVIILTLHP